jgi:uncharacterized membrane protein
MFRGCFVISVSLVRIFFLILLLLVYLVIVSFFLTVSVEDTSHYTAFQRFVIVTTASLVAFASGGTFQVSSNGIVIGGINGPINFSRPEGERFFYFYVPSTYTPSKPLPFIIYFHGYNGSWSQGVTWNQTVDAETNDHIIAFGHGTPRTGAHVVYLIRRSLLTM